MKIGKENQNNLGFSVDLPSMNVRRFIRRYTNPILLYFFRAKSGKKNFGDESSFFIVRRLLDNYVLKVISNHRLKFMFQNRFHLSAILVQPVFRKKTKLFAIGSILGPKVNNRDVIWGSGFIAQNEMLNAETKELIVLAVRGKYSLRKLKDIKTIKPHEVALGDPGILISQFVSAKKKCDPKIVVIPHYMHQKRWEELNVISKSQYDVVNVREDVEKVAERISAASVVISSSLHGIVFAHSYSIPAIRMAFDGEPLKGGDFKFDDYMSIFESDVCLPTFFIGSDQKDLNIDKILLKHFPISPVPKRVTEIQDRLITVLRKHYCD